MNGLAVVTPLHVVMQLAATIILFYIIHKYAYKSYLVYMEKRTTHINGSIDRADENLKLSEVELAKFQNERNELRDEKNNILSTTSKEAIIEKETIIKNSKERARLIIAKGNEELEKERSIVEGEISAEVMELVSLVSKKFVESTISKEDELKMINNAIEQVTNENK